VIVRGNRIKGTAYAGYSGQGVADGNIITNTMRVLNDGGGIYVFAYGATLTNNVVINSTGNVVSSFTGTPYSVSFYVDGYCAAPTLVMNNTGIGGFACLFVNGCPNVTVTNNTCYDDYSTSKENGT